jgi:hypothetical protein
MSRKQRVVAVSLVLVSLLVTSVVISGCGSGQSSGPASSSRVEGELSQEKRDVKITGSVSLSSTVSSATVFSTTTNLDAQNRYFFTDVKPGTYVVKITVSANPCFLGAPGAVFNGMMAFFQKGWGGTGISLKDGSSAIIGTTDVFTITGSETVKQTLALPRCYSR